MSDTINLDRRENSNEINPNDVVENSIENCPKLQQLQQYVRCKVALVKQTLEVYGLTVYIQELNRLDDAMYLLSDFTAYALISAIVQEPMAQEVIEDGLKGKPAEYRAYFDQLKNCGTIPPVFQPCSDEESLDAN